jgi:hypothetical protein
VGLKDLIVRSTPKASDRYERHPQVKWRVIEGLVVLIDANEGQLMHLNDVGSHIWQGLDGKKSVDQVISELDNAFDASSHRLRKDTLKFLKRLSLMELIRKADCHAL